MFFADLLERAARTAGVAFVVAFLGSLGASVTHGLDWSLAWWQSAALAATTAGTMAIGTAILAVITKPVGSKDTASVLPPVTSIDLGSLAALQPAAPPAQVAETIAAVSAGVPVPVGSQHMTVTDPATIPGYASPVPSPPVHPEYGTTPVRAADSGPSTSVGPSWLIPPTTT